jgi:hypothetical protein
LRRWDLTTAKRVDRFIANSSTTAERLSRIYGREAAVIPPPVADRYSINSVVSNGNYHSDTGGIIDCKSTV